MTPAAESMTRVFERQRRELASDLLRTQWREYRSPDPAAIEHRLNRLRFLIEQCDEAIKLLGTK